MAAELSAAALAADVRRRIASSGGPLKLVFLGAPGSGKGTQIQLLQMRVGAVAKLAPGDMLRDAVKRGTEVGRKAKAIMERGELVPDDIITELVRAKLQAMVDGGELGTVVAVIFDGYPRSAAQARSLDAMLREIRMPTQGAGCNAGASRGSGMSFAVQAAVEVDTPEDVIVELLKHRYMCASPGCGASYNSAPGRNHPRVEGVCDLCGGTQFARRKDDAEEVVRKRLATHRANNAGVVEHYAKRGLLCKADGTEADAELTHVRVLRILSKL